MRPSDWIASGRLRDEIRAAVAWRTNQPLTVEMIDLEGPRLGGVLVEGQGPFQQPARAAQRRISNEAAVVRLVGALLLEQNDEWSIQRRYMSPETLAPLGSVRVRGGNSLTAAV